MKQRGIQQIHETVANMGMTYQQKECGNGNGWKLSEINGRIRKRKIQMWRIYKIDYAIIWKKNTMGRKLLINWKEHEDQLWRSYYYINFITTKGRNLFINTERWIISRKTDNGQWELFLLGLKTMSQIISLIG